MASVFTWLDYSEHEQRKMLDVISALRETDTRDELGIGIVRDALADLLFPGTSTVQTRARYFLFVPWIYVDLQRRRTPSDQIAASARRKEIDLIDALAASDDPSGTIGIEARRSLQRLPSNIYWQGLAQWGIRIFPGSQAQYHAFQDNFYASQTRSQRNDDGEPVDGSTGRNWHGGLPAPPQDFPRVASFALTAEEASYLYERIMTRLPGTLLAFLVDLHEAMDPTAFAWESPVAEHLPSKLAEQLEHARNFSIVIHGASLLYNLMLAEKRQSEELVDEYSEMLADWSSQVDAFVKAPGSWNTRRFWEIIDATGARVTLLTRRFIDTWLSLALSPGVVTGIADNAQARTLIHERERLLKHGLARLDNPRSLELWNGAAGAGQLTYRWRVAQTMVADILNGLP